jgi:hypothetical protein
MKKGTHSLVISGTLFSALVLALVWTGSMRAVKAADDINPAGTHTPLYHKEINDKVNTVNGKALIMVLDEVKRFDKFSIIRVKHTSGAAAPSTMFTFRCVYEMAKLRKADYFIHLKEWTDEKGEKEAGHRDRRTMCIFPGCDSGEFEAKSHPRNSGSVRAWANF